MAEKKGTKPICIVNDQGATVIAMNSMKRTGDKIAINGVLMGAWPSDMYVGPEDIWKLICLIIKSPGVIFYVLLLPFILMRWKAASRTKAKG